MKYWIHEENQKQKEGKSPRAWFYDRLQTSMQINLVPERAKTYPHKFYAWNAPMTKFYNWNLPVTYFHFWVCVNLSPWKKGHFIINQSYEIKWPLQIQWLARWTGHYYLNKAKHILDFHITKSLTTIYSFRAVRNGQKSPNQETCLWNRWHQKALNGSKLVLYEHEWPLDI